MARIIAEALDAELDVILVHKIGAPFQPEFAIGAVGERSEVYLNPEVGAMDIPQGYLEEEAKRQRELLKKRRQMYTPTSGPKDLRDRTVIIVDDGIATGSTMIAAIREVRTHDPRQVIVAAAVAPPPTAVRLSKEADRVILLDEPAGFYAVGQFFQNFEQVTDRDIVELLVKTQRDDKARR